MEAEETTTTTSGGRVNHAPDGAATIIATSGIEPPERGRLSRVFHDREFRRIVRIYGAILLGSTTLLALSVALGREHGLPAPTLSEFTHALTHEVGMAGLIVVFLALSFERISKREFERVAADERRKSIDAVRRAASDQLSVARSEFERLFLEERALIKKDVYVGVFGKRIPEAVRDAIEVQILESPFARKNVELTYWLYPVQATGGSWYMGVRAEMKYDIENLTMSGEVKNLELHPFVAKPPDGLRDQVGFLSFSARGCKVPFSLTREELQDLTFENGADLVLRLAPRYLIEVTTDPTVICVESVEVDHLRFSHQTFVAKHYITDLVLTVHTSRCGPHIQVSATANASKPLEIISADATLGYFRWRSTGPLLPMQGIEISWMYSGNVSEGANDTSTEDARESSS